MGDADLLLRIWGARGSIPAPAAPNCRTGSDTCCVEIRCGPHVLVFDAGTGAASLGARLEEDGVTDIDLFFTHCHLDHIVGLPFMRQLYRSDATVRLHAGHFEDDTTCRAMVEGFMKPPYFPLTAKNFRASIDYVDFRPPQTLTPRPGISVRTARLNHPNGAIGYRVDFVGRSICYVTDTEHRPGAPDSNILGLIEGADIVIYDAMYTDEDFEKFRGYGHSTWQEGVRLCEAAGAKRMVIFHHRHDRDDEGLAAIEKEAQARFPGALLATTGLELSLGHNASEGQWRRKA